MRQYIILGGTGGRKKIISDEFKQRFKDRNNGSSAYKNLVNPNIDKSETLFVQDRPIHNSITITGPDQLKNNRVCRDTAKDDR